MLVPPVTIVLPEAVVYQSIVHSEGAVTLNVTVPLPHRALLLGLEGVDGAVFAVIATVLPPVEVVQALFPIRRTQ